jgi:hypothetical protein
MVLPEMTEDHTPFVSSYHPSFQRPSVIEGAGVGVGITVVRMGSGVGVTTGAAGGAWVVQPHRRPASVRSPTQIINLACMVPGVPPMEK